MFHKHTFGRYGNKLPCDLNGFVPEEGDEYFQFTFEDGFDEDVFDDFVLDAVKATKEAEEGLNEWRKRFN